MAYLDIKNLSVSARSANEIVKIVDGVSFTIDRGEIFGIVGESGSGKTMTCSAMLSLLPNMMSVTADKMTVADTDLLTSSPSLVRGKLISMIFQDPAAALNPVFSIRSQINAVLKRHTTLTSANRKQRLHQLLSDVGLPDTQRVARSYPHELSGGMQQRVLIAMALSTGAQMLIADEPTTALDVTVQAQILELLKSLRERLGLTIIFISHDLAVVSQVCDRVAVMRHGDIVEQGYISTVLGNPQHAYTRALLASRLGGESARGSLPTVAASLLDGAKADD